MFQVSRRTRRTDRHRLKEFLEIWKLRRPQTYNVPSLIAVLDSQVLLWPGSYVDHINNLVIIGCMWMVSCSEWQFGRTKYFWELHIRVDITINWSHAGDGNDVKSTKESHLLFSVVKWHFDKLAVSTTTKKVDTLYSLKLTSLPSQNEKMIMRINATSWLSMWLLSWVSLCWFCHPGRVCALSSPEGPFCLRPKPARHLYFV